MQSDRAFKAPCSCEVAAPWKRRSKVGGGTRITLYPFQDLHTSIPTLMHSQSQKQGFHSFSAYRNRGLQTYPPRLSLDLCSGGFSDSPTSDTYGGNPSPYTRDCMCSTYWSTMSATNSMSRQVWECQSCSATRRITRHCYARASN